jgi:hypothetical protein
MKSNSKAYAYILLVAFALCLVFVWLHIASLAESIQKPERLSDFQARAIELFTENARALSSYAMLVLAGVGYFVQLIFSKESHSRVTKWGRFLLIAAVLLSAGSLLFGYFCYNSIIDILGSELAFDPNAPRVYVFRQLQFWTFLGSVAIFAIFTIEALLG